MPKMKPLEEWICDTCADVAPRQNCAVEWLSSAETGPHSFRIVHKTNRCYRHTNEYHRADLAIDSFLGEDGLQQLLAMLSVGPILDAEMRPRPQPDLNGFADLARRTQIPYYEEARLYFEDAKDDGWYSDQNEVSIFLPKTCKSMIERYEKA